MSGELVSIEAEQQLLGGNFQIGNVRGGQLSVEGAIKMRE